MMLSQKFMVIETKNEVCGDMIKLVMIPLRMIMSLIIMIPNMKRMIISMIGYNHDNYFYD